MCVSVCVCVSKCNIFLLFSICFLLLSICFLLFNICFLFFFFLGYLFIISVVTSDMRHAGTDSNVFICLYGSSKKESCSGKIWLKDGKFERGKTDIFNVNVAILLSPVSKLEVGHDNSGRAPGWFLDHVIVDCPSTGIKQVFLCNRWLALNEDDGLIQRILYEEKSLRKTAEQSK